MSHLQIQSSQIANFFSTKLSKCVNASVKVNPHAQALLEAKNYWKKEYHFTVIETVLDTAFDLIITVCDNAKETCPMFPKAVKTMHISFEDPSGKAIEEYEKTLNLNLYFLIHMYLIFQGNPWILSSSIKGSGSNSSILKTPLPLHLPSSISFAPIIAGTPVV